MIGRLLVIVGKAASGKTTLCHSLAGLGFSYLSASGVLRQFFAAGESPLDRQSLAERGKLTRSTPVIAGFHDALLRRIVENDGDVVLDGPRFAETVSFVRSSTKGSLLVYLDCPDEIRRQRLASDGRGSDWIWLERHPTETSVEEIRAMADIILDGRRTSGEVARTLRNAINQLSQSL